MIKKRVLVYGSLDSLMKFLESPFSVEYEVFALISRDFEGIDTNRLNVSDIELVPLRSVYKFVYKLIDALVITENKNRQSTINYFISQGIEPQKIILWNEQGVPEFFLLQESDGTKVAFMEGLQFHISTQEESQFFNFIHCEMGNQKKFYSLKPSQYRDMLDIHYRQVTGRNVNWDAPETFTEKIQWLKIYDSTPLKTRLADKYLVRKWIAEMIGEEYLIPLLGVWNNFDEIDFDELPDQFVLKCNHGSGMNIIVHDRKNFSIQNAREKINAWMSMDFGAFMCELHYNDIKKKIIAEEFITDGKSVDINDYKFWCFDGRVEYVQVDRNRSTNHVQRFYTPSWEPLSFIIASHTLDNKIMEKPSSLEEMLHIAEKLSVGFSIVRVDLYCVEDKIYFGEMTFTPLSGYVRWNPEDTDYRIGFLIKLNRGNHFV